MCSILSFSHLLYGKYTYFYAHKYSFMIPYVMAVLYFITGIPYYWTLRITLNFHYCKQCFNDYLCS